MGEPAENTVVGFTIDALREAIRAGTFAPGQRLIVGDITRLLNVSAGPVREAIRRLTGEGLIQIEPHRGASVRKVTKHELREIHQVRAAVEGMAAGLAAERAGDAAFRAELGLVREEMDRCDASEDIAGFLANNQRFHDLILRMADNELMRQFAQQLILPLYQFRLPHRMTLMDLHASYAAHQRIIAAILSGKAGAADQAMREHILQSGRGMVTALESIESARNAERPRRARVGEGSATTG